MTTKLAVRNNTGKAVTAFITLGATEGCVQDVADLIVSGTTIDRLYPLQGSFVLGAYGLARIGAPEGDGLNGNFSFGTPPLNCPTDEFPHGVNLAEFIINNGFQENGQETVDISGVCGANAYVSINLTANDWVANTSESVHEIRNGAWDDNSSRVGVYPYGCDNCTASTSPPACVGLQPQFANAEPICNVQRNAALNQGGAVLIGFNGPI